MAAQLAEAGAEAPAGGGAPLLAWLAGLRREGWEVVDVAALDAAWHAAFSDEDIELLVAGELREPFRVVLQTYYDRPSHVRAVLEAVEALFEAKGLGLERLTAGKWWPKKLRDRGFVAAPDRIAAQMARDPWLNDPGERDAVLRANMKVITRRAGLDSR